jgi:hypothetical protein
MQLPMLLCFGNKFIHQHQHHLLLVSVEEYNHSGYVNMASNVVFPETTDKIWTTARDRLFWLDDGPGNSFSEIVPGNSNTNCYSIDLTTTNPCCVTTSTLSDAFFMRKEGNFLYAGIAEGFAANMGLGYVIKNDHTNPTNKIWKVEGNAICGDPLKFFINNGIKYVLVKPSPNAFFNATSLLYLNGSGNWTVVPNLPTTGIRDVDMITIGGVNHYLVIANSGAGSQTIYHFTGDLTNSPALVCTIPNEPADYFFERLKILPFNSFTELKVLVGTSPADPPLSNITYFHELNSGSSCTLNPVPVSNAIFQNLHLDKIDNVDEGVTAIEVNFDREIIYVATVSFDATQTVQVKSHLYKTTYTDATGVINPNWTEITGNAPNKTFTYLNSNNSTSNCNEQYVYACVRGLGAWKFEENPVLITTSNDVVCSGAANASATAGNPFGGTATYLWSNLQTTQTATGLGAGTYTVTVTSTSSTCTASATTAISEDPNCCNTYNQYLDEGDLNSGNISGDWNLNESVICAGTVNISNANIAIRQGVSITIPNGVTVTVDGSTLFACGNMWQGFVVEDGGALTITNSSTIRDAQYATHVKNNGNLTIENNSLLEHNYVGVYNDFNTTGSVIISGSQFKCTDCLNGTPLKNPYPGQTPVPNTISHAGILGVGSTFNIGVAGTDANQFEDLYNGVSLSGCYTTVLNSGFKNMHASGSYSSMGGVGIYAFMKTSGFLRQIGFGGDASSAVSFTNCAKGIYTIGGDALIGSNNMNNVITGIECTNAKAQDITIGYNNIDAFENGIKLTSNDLADRIRIEYNTVYVNSATGEGVLIADNGTPSTSRVFNVNCNAVTIVDGLYGFHLLSTGNVNLQQNTVSIQTMQRYANGFALEASNYCKLTENYATGNSIDLHNSFFASMSDGNQLTNNHADNTANGFDYWNLCYNTNFRGNTMNRHNIGLHLNSSAVIGLQPSGNPAYNNGNRWLAYAGGNNPTWVGAVNQNTAGGINGWPGSIFYTHITNPPDIFYPNYNSNQVSGWFQPFPGTPFSATYSNICIIASDAPPDEQALRLDTLIVQDSIYAVDFQPELRYNAKRSLYKKLSQNDSLKNDNGLFESFYDSLQTVNAGAYSDIKLILSQPLNYLSALQIIDSLIQLKLDSLVIYDSIIHASNAGNSNPAKLFCLSALSDYIHQSDSLLMLINTELHQRKQDASSANAALSFENDIEVTENAVNDFHFIYSEYSIDSIPQSSITSIENIASLCPFAYGVAVYKARAELERLGFDSLVYSDSSTCALLGYFRQSGITNNTDLILSDFTIMPNPANQIITLNFNSLTNASDIVNIFGLDGKLIYSSILNTDLLSVQIDISFLTPSIYNIQYIHYNCNSFKKLTIIK